MNQEKQKKLQKVIPKPWPLAVTNTFLMPDFRHALTLQHLQVRPTGCLPSRCVCFCCFIFLFVIVVSIVVHCWFLTLRFICCTAHRVGTRGGILSRALQDVAVWGHDESPALRKCWLRPEATILVSLFGPFFSFF